MPLNLIRYDTPMGQFGALGYSKNNVKFHMLLKEEIE